MKVTYVPGHEQLMRELTGETDVAVSFVDGVSEVLAALDKLGYEISREVEIEGPMAEALEQFEQFEQFERM